MTSEQYMNLVDSGQYDWTHDGAGWGICQYTFYSLKAGFLDYCKQHNKSIGDLEMQLEYMFIVIKRDCKPLWNVLQNAVSVREASNKMLFDFERPSDQGQREQDIRCGYGEEAYNRFFKGTVTPIPKKPELQVAEYFDKQYRKRFTTTADLHLRAGAGKDDFDSLVIMPKGSMPMCYGYYNPDANGVKWMYVVANVAGKQYTGYCSSEYLKG